MHLNIVYTGCDENERYNIVIYSPDGICNLYAVHHINYQELLLVYRMKALNFVLHWEFYAF